MTFFNRGEGAVGQSGVDEICFEHLIVVEFEVRGRTLPDDRTHLCPAGGKCFGHPTSEPPRRTADHEMTSIQIVFRRHRQKWLLYFYLAPRLMMDTLQAVEDEARQKCPRPALMPTRQDSSLSHNHMLRHQ